MAIQSTLLDAFRRTDSIVEELEGFSFSGERTIREDRDGATYLLNEFWTARQRQGHSLHEVSYRACFKPQLPAFLIERLTDPGAWVYDPFMGRGTTLIEAGLMGRNAAGNDINPLSAMLCRPRLVPITLKEVNERLGLITWSHPAIAAHELLVFYHPDTLGELLALRHYLLEREAMGELDHVDDWIRMVALNRLTGHSSGFFSVYSLPPNQAVSVAAQSKINAKRSQTPPRRSVPEIILKKSKALLKDGSPPAVNTRFVTGPAENTPGLATGSIDLVVTSPPFLDIVQYASDNWLRCWFAGIDAGEVDIAMHRKPSAWSAWVREVFTELGRVVRPGGHVAFEVGEVRGGKVELDRVVLGSLPGLPFEVVCVMVNVQEFTKTANCWGVSNNALGTNTNRIVIVRRK